MKSVFITLILLASISVSAQLLQNKVSFTRADTLRGSITDFRKNWDVLHYDLSISLDINKKSIIGTNVITYYESMPVRVLQIDLQDPLQIDSIISESGHKLSYTKDGFAWMVRLKPDGAMIKFLPGIRSLKVYYHGNPKKAERAPWDGGFVWQNDQEGNPFIATACQGLGASVWWPCKDHQSDEPDSGMVIKVTVPDTLVAISNGRLVNTNSLKKGTKTFTWKVTNPINNYAVAINVGKYVNWSDTLIGEGGKLDINYWAIKSDETKAKEQFEQVKPMLRSFEYWFGKYPWYADGYKLVQAPFLGMEHQSSVAYGNAFKNGYLGRDLSGTGWGLKWDFIIIHESGHEWFGNNITTKDIADMWVHEGFTNYSETLFTETYYGKQAADEYNFGSRRNIRNDKPIIGNYNVNNEGSGDMYAKASSMIHTIRKAINNDTKFRNILRGLNDTFYHQVVETKQVEDFISNQSGINLDKVFDQYLRTTQIPKFEFYFSPGKDKVFYRWTNCVNGFDLPLYLHNQKLTLKINPQTDWKSLKITQPMMLLFDRPVIEKDYLITVQEVEGTQ